MLRTIIERFHLWRRRERRIEQFPATGRVFQSTAEKPSGDMVAKARPEATITPSRVWSAKEEKWYPYEEWLRKQKDADLWRTSTRQPGKNS